MLLSEWAAQFIDDLRREDASPHTIRNYASDLAHFCDFLDGGAEPDVTALRMWLASVHESGASAVTMPSPNARRISNTDPSSHIVSITSRTS